MHQYCSAGSAIHFGSIVDVGWNAFKERFHNEKIPNAFTEYAVVNPDSRRPQTDAQEIDNGGIEWTRWVNA